MTKTLFIFLIAIVGYLPTSLAMVHAHDGGHGQANDATRAWTLRDGTHIHGTLINADDEVLRLMSSQGTMESIEIWRLSGGDRLWLARKRHEIEELNSSPRIQLVSFSTNQANQSNADARPAAADAFQAFDKTVKLRWDQDYLYVESNGIPDHPLMVGIRSWQQQVPLPQPYFGNNAWQIPLHPVPAKTPASTKDRFLRGAIAIAVNGIPIFNPLNNRGDDAFLFGELDEFGGHCGRADDYHYHLAPVHLEKIVGQGQPIAYALDGYPIFGYQDPQAPDFAPLDRLGGHKDKDGNYHYHATDKYPYLNGGFYGQVVERGGQVDPQPRAEPLRPALQPLPGAKITKFENQGNKRILTYEVKGRVGTVEYTQLENGTYSFVLTDPAGKVKSESYRPRGGPPRPRQTEPRQQPAPRKAESPASATNGNAQKSSDQLQLSSDSVNAQGFLSIDCTCDGKRQSPAIAWKNLPEGTKALAISFGTLRG